MATRRPEILPSLFGHTLATPDSVGGEAPVFCPPEGEGCGARHADVGTLGGRSVCVLAEVADSFRQPIARLVDLAREAGEQERLAAGAHTRFLRGIVRATQRGIREDREAAGSRQPEAEAVPPLAEPDPQPEASTMADEVAFKLGVHHAILLQREDVAPREIQRRLAGMEARALALGFQRSDELFLEVTSADE